MRGVYFDIRGERAELDLFGLQRGGLQTDGFAGSSCGRQHVAVLGQTNLYLYETATGKPLHDEGHRGPVNAVAFAPNGQTLATSDLTTVRIWDGAAGNEVRRWSSYFVRGNATLAFSSDGKLLAHTGAAALQLWNPATGEELPQFRSLQASSATFSADGALLDGVPTHRSHQKPLSDNSI